MVDCRNKTLCDLYIKESCKGYLMNEPEGLPSCFTPTILRCLGCGKIVVCPICGGVMPHINQTMDQNGKLFCSASCKKKYHSNQGIKNVRKIS
jgi:hypothetical protein